VTATLRQPRCPEVKKPVGDSQGQHHTTPRPLAALGLRFVCGCRSARALSCISLYKLAGLEPSRLEPCQPEQVGPAARRKLHRARRFANTQRLPRSEPIAKHQGQQTARFEAL